MSEDRKTPRIPGEGKFIVGDEQATRQVIARIFREGIKPHCDDINRIWSYGRVAVLVFEPHPDALSVLRGIGWDGKCAVFALSDSRVRRLIGNYEAEGDSVTARWLRIEKPGQGRMFIWAGRGTLLYNFNEKDGFFLEPGSTDAEFFN